MLGSLEQHAVDMLLVRFASFETNYRMLNPGSSAQSKLYKLAPLWSGCNSEEVRQETDGEL